MEKWVLLFSILIVSSVFASGTSETEMTGDYTILVEENGDVLITLSVNGSGTMNLPLPLDVVSPSIEHALYIQAPNGIDVSVGTARRAVVIYRTSLLTTKQSGIWNFEMELPQIDFVSVSMVLPKNVEIIQSSPQAWITQSPSSTDLLWELNPRVNGTLSFQYRFVQHVPTQTPAPTPIVNETLINETIEPAKNESAHESLRSENKSSSTPTPQVNETEEASENYSANLTIPDIDQKSEFFSGKNLLLFIILISTLSVSVYFYYVTPKNKGFKKPTKGVTNIINTLSENEHTIVGILIQYNGEMKRNKLEKTSGLAKSSLASALYRLEQRNIVEIDKSGAIHYVRFTDWFRSL